MMMHALNYSCYILWFKELDQIYALYQNMRMRAQFFIILCRKYLSNEMERLQKRALGIIQPDLSYAEALVALDITSLYERRKALSNALFDQIVRDQSHKLHDLLPPRNGSTYCTRSQRYFKLPICKTNRFKNTFIMANSFNCQQ